MKTSCKEICENTKILMNEINYIVERHVAKNKYSKSDKKYTKKIFLDDVRVSYTTARKIVENNNKSSITLETAVRLLHGCGMKFKIVPEIMPKEFYMHKDIILPDEYENDC